MNIETLRSFFLWCSVINYSILLLWAAAAILGRDWLYRLWGRCFQLSHEQFDILNIYGMTIYKTGIILFNIVPCIVLYFIV